MQLYNSKMFCQEFWKDASLDLWQAKKSKSVSSNLVQLFLAIMKKQDFQLILLRKNQNELHFQEIIRSQDMPCRFLWTFRIKENGNTTLEISPYYLGSHGSLLKIDNPAAREQFLKLLIYQNTLIDPWLISLTDDNQIFIRSTLPSFNQFIQAQFKIRQQSKKIFKKIFSLAQYYTVTLTLPSLPIPTKSIFDKNYQITKELTSWILRLQYSSSKMIQMMNVDKKKKKIELRNNLEDLQQKIKGQKSNSKLYLRSVLSIMNLSHSCFNNIEVNVKDINKSIRRTLGNECNENKKNFYGVKILKKSIFSQCIKQYKEYQFIKAKCQLLFLNSIHAYKNGTVEANQALLGYEPNEFKKKLVVTIKRMKGPQNLSTAYKNQIQFIQYAKKFKGCKYISTCYIEESKEFKNKQKQYMMDYYGKNLEELCQKNPTVAQKLDILYKVIKGVRWLHDINICHRSLKPEQIMIDDCGDPKIVGFGYCCSNYQSEHMPGSYKSSKNKLKINRAYCAQYEQYIKLPLKNKLNRQYYHKHPQFDIYSLGKFIEKLFGESFSKGSSIHNFLCYLKQRCTSLNPDQRPNIIELEDIFGWLKSRHSSYALRSMR